jgi:hypothetical protein
MVPPTTASCKDYSIALKEMQISLPKTENPRLKRRIKKTAKNTLSFLKRSELFNYKSSKVFVESIYGPILKNKLSWFQVISAIN